MSTMDAFNRFNDTLLRLLNIEPGYSPRDDGRSHHASCEFLQRLPKFDLSSISSEDKACNICQESYGTGD